MTLPFLPLKSVFFPGETVPLHIFEPRYKALIRDCRQETLTFGIPVYIDKAISHGTEVQLVEVVTTYANGEMDVRCLARQAFRVLSFTNPMEGKPYPGGEVDFMELDFRTDPGLRESVIKGLEALYRLMELPLDPLLAERFNSFHLAHRMGLSLAQEFELLKMPGETQRLQYIREHLDRTVNLLDEVNRTKAGIALNGHFKNFDPLDFSGLLI